VLSDPRDVIGGMRDSVYLKRYEDQQRCCDSCDNRQCDTSDASGESIVKDVKVRGAWWNKFEEHDELIPFAISSERP